MKRRSQGNKEQKLVAINDLFAKYRNRFRAPEGSVVTAVCDVVVRITGYQISRDQVTYNVRDRVVFLRTRGVLRSELLLQKQQILDQLTAELGKQSAPHDLR